MESKKVVISTSSLNNYGFRVLTSGIDIEQYKKNPIVLWMHNRSMWGKSDEVLPIGTMKKIAKEGDNLVGEIEFDTTDDFAKKIEAKWNAGVLKMVSAGLSIKESSSDVKHMIDGQTRPTVTKSKLIEVSVVDIGANDDALALYNEDSTVINLSIGMENTLPLIKNKNMDEISKLLGLPKGSTEQQVVDKINQLKLQNENLTTTVAQLKTQEIESLVESAVNQCKFSEDKKQHFVQLGQSVGIEQLKLTLDAIIPTPTKTSESNPLTPQKPKILTNLTHGTPSNEYSWKKLSDVPEDKIDELRANDLDAYKKLYKEEFGVALK